MDQNQFQYEEQQNNSNQQPVVKNAAYFRKRAREALKPFLGVAIVVGILFTLLAGGGGSGAGLSLNFSPSFLFEAEEENETITDMEQDSVGIIGGADLPTFTSVAAVFAGIFGAILLFVMVLAFAYNLLVASPIRVGYEKFNLELIDGNQSGIVIGTLFSFFKRSYGKCVVLNLLYSLVMLIPALPMLLAMVGGIVAMVALEASTAGVMIFTLALLFGATVTGILMIIFAYRYAFTFTILADHPEISPIEALHASSNMMKGNKWRLFCLEFSFIGWMLLAVCCTCGIGSIFLNPYMYAARTAFYNDISNRRQAQDVEFPSINPDDYVIE